MTKKTVLLLIAPIVFRYAAVAVASFSRGDDPKSMFAKIRPDIKEWIQTIATNTQDSDCGQ